jgi:hypothetical protein
MGHGGLPLPKVLKNKPFISSIMSSITGTLL